MAKKKAVDLARLCPCSDPRQVTLTLLPRITQKDIKLHPRPTESESLVWSELRQASVRYCSKCDVWLRWRNTALVLSAKRGGLFK